MKTVEIEMQTTSESQQPFLSRPRDWTLLRRVVKWTLSIAGVGFVALISYAASTYVHNVAADAATNALQLVTPLVAKVQTLEEFKARNEKQMDAMQIQMTTVLIKLSTLESLQDANNKNTERILRKLDKSNP